MPKLHKVKRSKKYGHNVNRKRLRNKQRKLPTINCSQIKNAWDSNKSTRKNLAQMGLAYDSNEVFQVPNIKQKIMKNTTSGEFRESENKKQNEKKFPKKIKVVLELEADATAPRERRFRLPKSQVQFLTYLMDKYDDDFKAMARDKKNHYQLTWKQIRSKINVFKGIPEQYAEYLLHKGEIILEDPTPLEETKKKIAEENYKKYSVRKTEKKKKGRISLWTEEDVDDESDEFNTTKTLEDIEGGKSEIHKRKKLKLFPDEGSDDDSQKEIIINNKENLKQLSSNDSDGSDRDLEENEHVLEFKDLDELSDEELSEDDILDDEDFGTDSADDTDEE